MTKTDHELPAGICVVRGSFRQLWLTRSEGQSTFSGDLENVEFYSPEFLPKLAGSLASVYSETYSTSDVPREAQSSCVWMGVLNHKDVQEYHFSFMLPDADFQLFSTMAMTHLGRDLNFAFKFEYPQFGAPSREQFFDEGRNMVIRNAAIELSFGCVRSGLKSA
jgi:hypothetical protein